MSDSTPVKTFFASFAAGDLAGALAVIDDTVQVHEPAGLLAGGEYGNKAAFVGFLQKVAGLYSVEIVDLELLDAGRVTVALVDTSWTSTATGRVLRTQMCEVYTVRDGLIVDIDVYPKDTRALHELTLA